jgi:hypothetical protein
MSSDRRERTLLREAKDFDHAKGDPSVAWERSFRMTCLRFCASPDSREMNIETACKKQYSIFSWVNERVSIEGGGPGKSQSIRFPFSIKKKVQSTRLAMV